MPERHVSSFKLARAWANSRLVGASLLSLGPAALLLIRFRNFCTALTSLSDRICTNSTAFAKSIFWPSSTPCPNAPSPKSLVRVLLPLAGSPESELSLFGPFAPVVALGLASFGPEGFLEEVLYVMCRVPSELP
eukprot:CAMPEP_0184297322 /NCGR_PEP_ID=MMETSP1049-20130417/8244_1 /TAXON_ID=77928 /ORGANISM="Proteomonas sulcata, Strain CCMP704" /LENGTH=133 /DNA_ID=CAMNT_0026607001 /DNA_START=319 /DNA_END=720 /DNA_ORIENTATION=-